MSPFRLSAPDAALLLPESPQAPRRAGRTAPAAAVAPAALDTSFDRPAPLARRGGRPIGRAGAPDALPLRHSGAAQLAGA